MDGQIPYSELKVGGIAPPTPSFVTGSPMPPPPAPLPGVWVYHPAQYGPAPIRPWEAFFAWVGMILGFFVLLTIPGWFCVASYRRWKRGEARKPSSTRGRAGRRAAGPSGSSCSPRS